MPSPTALDNLYASFQVEANDTNLTKIKFIQILNRVLSRMAVTKPAEQVSPLYYLRGYEKYQIPQAGFRDAIALYAENQPVIYYVSPLRFRLQDPLHAFTDQSDNGLRFLKVRFPGSRSKVVQMTAGNDLTGDGAWSISGGSNLALDTTSEADGEGKISFSVSAAQAIVTFVRSSVIDASSFSAWMRARMYVWLPQTTYLTSITIRIGNDASNYFEQSVTAQASLEPFTNSEKNELEFAQESATQVGSVDKSAIDWFQLELNFSQSVSLGEFAVNKIAIGQPEKLDLEWYTNYLAYDVSGNLIQAVTEDESSTDDPIIKNYPDYLSTVLDGSLYEYLKIPDPARAASFYTRFIGEKDPNGIYINGLGYLKIKYPSRRAQYKRIKTLPDLNYNTGSHQFYDENH